MATAFDILVKDNQATPTPRGNLKRRGAYGLRFSTILPGGCAECTFNLPFEGNLQRLIIPTYLGFNYRVDVMDGGEFIWSGRMEDVVFHKGTDGYYFTVTARGYGMNLNDQMYTTQNVQGQVSSATISQAITDLAPQIGSVTITATGFTLNNAAAINLQMMTAGAVIAWAARYGDSAYNPQQWFVYPTSNGTIEFTFEARPTATDVEGYLSDFVEAEMGLFGKNAYNRAIIRYNSGGTYYQLDNTTQQGAGPTGWGVVRALNAVLPEITSSADAAQAANTMLSQFGTLRMAATSLRAPAGAKTLRLYDTNGAPVKPWSMKAGQLFRFRDVDPAQQAQTNLAWSNAFVIAGTEYDEDAQTVTLTPEGFDNSAEKLQAKVEYLLRGRYGLGGVA